MTDYPLGGWYGIGIIEGQTPGVFTIAFKNGSFRGTIFYNNSRYHFSKQSNSLDKVRLVRSGQSAGLSASYTSLAEKIQSHSRMQNTVIDCMFVYSSTFSSRLGDYDSDSLPGTQDDIDTLFMDATNHQNLVYVNSGINITRQITYTYASNHPEGHAETSERFGPLLNTNDGFLDEIFAVRDLVKADLVSFYTIIDPANIGWTGGGSALLYNTTPTMWMNSRTNAVSEIYDSDGIGPNAHENGHSMGVAHNRDQLSSPRYEPHSSIPFANGYYSPTCQFHTILGNYSPSCGPYIERYSDPNAMFMGEPMGIDHTVDPANSADAVLAHSITAPIVAAFRTGTPTYPDFDNDGILDIIEIAHGASDCDNDGVPDDNQIAADPSIDCDSNGVIDTCELDWNIHHFEQYPAISTNVPITIRKNFAPDSDITIEVQQKVKYANPVNHEISLYINGAYSGPLFEEGIYPWSSNCITKTDSITIPLNSIPTPMEPNTIEVELQIHNSVNTQSCAISRFTKVQIDYQTISSVDEDRDGIINCVDSSCNLADYDENGVLNNFDVSMFSSYFTSSDPRADIASPLGVWNFFDFSKFMSAFNAGCP